MSASSFSKISSPLGSYLAACVFAAALWKRDPRGLEVPQGVKIAVADAEFLQNAAWQSAQASHETKKC